MPVSKLCTLQCLKLCVYIICFLLNTHKNKNNNPAFLSLSNLTTASFAHTPLPPQETTTLSPRCSAKCSRAASPPSSWWRMPSARPGHEDFFVTWSERPAPPATPVAVPGMDESCGRPRSIDFSELTIRGLAKMEGSGPHGRTHPGNVQNEGPRGSP